MNVLIQINAAYPMPIIFNIGGSGGGRIETLYAALIAINIICVLYFIIKSVKWLSMKYKTESLLFCLFSLETDIWYGGNFIFAGLLFYGINSFAIIAWFISFIEKTFF